MQIQPYLFFDGHCEEAIEFYSPSLGAKIGKLMRHKDSPEPPPPGMVLPGMEDKVMHASFRIGDSSMMASDDCTGTRARFQGIQLVLAVADDAEAAHRFAALADGGQVKKPLTKTFFASGFGMVVDRFRVPWTVIAAPMGS